MEFITTEKFNQLGYTFNEEFTPNNLGSTYHVIVTDKDGNEVVHAQSSYANLSGRGYAMSGVQHQAVADLEVYIENPNKPKEEDLIDWDFLNELANWEYINDYGFDKNGTLTILFDTWRQLEGEDEYPSVFAKFVALAEKGLLKDKINYTLTHFESAFTDEYMKCCECGRILHRDWEGIRYVEGVGEVLCDDCINKSESAIESLIDEAKDDFSKALPVMISEDKIKELGYEAVDDTDFSTRSSQWGENSWSCHNLDTDICRRLCCDYDGFAKLTGVYQFEAEFQLYFPSNTVEQARKELKTIL